MDVEANTIFIKYLRSSLQKLYDYFLNGSWIDYQTNIYLLSKFILGCAYAYPEKTGKELFNNPSYSEFQPQEMWMRNTSGLIAISEEIRGRKRPGLNDKALCYRAHKLIRSMKSTVLDNWIGRCPDIPEEVRNILDNDSRYFNPETKR